MQIKKTLLPELTLSRGLAIFMVVTVAGTAILSVFHFYWGTRQVAKIEARYSDSSTSKSPDTDQKPDPTKSASASSPLDSIEQFLPPDLPDDPLLQKVVAVMQDDSFQEAIKAQPPQSMKEMVDLLEAHGVTEFGEVDMDQLLADAYDSATQDYFANNPGQTPEDEDEEMAERFRELLKEYGPRDGVMKITMDRENLMWIGVRFKGDNAAFDTWWRDVIASYDLGESESTGPTPASSAEQTSQGIWADADEGTSNHTQSGMTEYPETEKRTVASPVVEQEKVAPKLSAPKNDNAKN